MVRFALTVCLLTAALTPIDRCRANGADCPTLEIELGDVAFPIPSVKDETPVKEVRLFVSSDDGATWRRSATFGPKADSFRYVAERAGMIWFAVQVERRDGSLRPEKVDKNSVVMKVNFAAKHDVLKRTELPPLRVALEKAGYMSVPLRKMNGHVAVPVKVRRDEYLFILDTGAYGAHVERSRTKTLDLNWRGTRDIAPTDKVSDPISAELDGLTIGSLTTKRLRLEAIDGWEIDGLLGLDVLAAHEAIIDFANWRLYLREPRMAEWPAVEVEVGDVAIPIARDARVKEVRLFVSTDAGASWRPAATAGPRDESFLYSHSHVGVVWFAKQAEYPDGLLQPEKVDTDAVIMKLNFTAKEAKPTLPALSANDVLGKAGYVNVPLQRLNRGTVALPANVKGVEYFFILDTGAPRTYLERTRTKALDLNWGGTRDAVITVKNWYTNRDERITDRFAEVDGLAIGPMTTRPLRVGAIDLSEGNGTRNDRKYDGLIGLDVLESHAAVVDVANWRLYLHGPRK